jgi:ssDNA-binding Zn-finger/Zn-ribbon topoisomerase 1
LRDASFNVAAFISTTGFTTVPYDSWPHLSQAVLVLLMFIGGCTGSTCGGLKIGRWLILIKNARRELRTMLHPRERLAVRSEGKVVENPQPKRGLAGFKCELCGGEMLVRMGKFGEFYACENFPECKFTKQKVVDTGANCPRCSSKIVGRRGRSKSLFFSCENYPNCDFSSWDLPLVEKCPWCGDMLYYRKSRKVVMCKNPSCDYTREDEITFDFG